MWWKQARVVGVFEVVAVEITLPADAESPRRARQFARNALAGADADMTDMVMLLVSEIVTNAVLHARSELRLLMTWNGPAVRVEVADLSPLLPAQRNFSAMATTGRGIQLVDEIADSWGLAPSDDGKVVWFELTASEKGPETAA